VAQSSPTQPSPPAAAACPRTRPLPLRILGPSLLFVMGFSLVFVLLGAGAGRLGQGLIHYRAALLRVAGLVIVLLGLFLLGLIRWRPLYRERRLPFPRLGRFTAPLAGMAFALGWTPCVGPFLGSIFSLAAASGKAGVGAFYLAVYSAGLALPFLIFALLLSTLLGTFRWLKRHFTLINTIAGILLIAMGGLVFFGKFEKYGALLFSAAPNTGLTALSGSPIGLATAFAAGLLSFLSPCVLPLVPGYLCLISGLSYEELTKEVKP
jgi:cytochrome c-type biogenesis protein